LDTAAIVAELKKELKRREVTYGTLAERLGMSEAAVKRFFAEENFSLKRLDAICDVLGLDLGALLRAATRAADEGPRPFPEDVEAALADDHELLLAFYTLALGGTAATAKQRLKTDKAGLHRVARRLEALGVLEVLPDERYRLAYGKSTRWRADGALARRYGGAIRDEFFASAFRGASEHQDFLTGTLAKESYAVLQRRLVEVFRQFDQLSRADASLPEAETDVFWLYAGIRPWAPLAVVERAVAVQKP
jgi:DNA-binding Xre family transcriptional regulator